MERRNWKEIPEADVVIKHINARINEGYNITDFNAVIDNKVNDWANTDMEKFLRPETLFGTKFEGYLNESAKKIEPELYQKFFDSLSKAIFFSNFLGP